MFQLYLFFELLFAQTVSSPYAHFKGDDECDGDPISNG